MRLEKAHILAQDFRATSKYVKSYSRSNISAKTTIFHLSGDNSVETPIWKSGKRNHCCRTHQKTPFSQIHGVQESQKYGLHTTIAIFFEEAGPNRPKMQKLTT